MNDKKNIWLAVIGIILAGSLIINGISCAQEDPAALKKRIQELNAQVTLLEKQLAEKKKPQASPIPAIYRPTTIDPWDPFAEMEMMQANMNQLFQHHGSGIQGQNSDFFNPKIDIKESPDHYTITMDIPGMNKDNIDVKIEKDELVISGVRQSASEENNADKFFRQERSYGQFMRAVPLPEDAKKDTIDAQYNNGELTIKVMRNPPEKETPKKISIK
ncbi:MAG: Hsp20/alpha crystallin family protein [Candidatus Omnitrophota bacterium]